MLSLSVLHNMNSSIGEVNMIYSLTFAFLENKKFEEAEKLMKVFLQLKLRMRSELKGKYACRLKPQYVYLV